MRSATSGGRSDGSFTPSSAARAIAVDLKSAKGRDLILRLAPKFDIVAQNFRAGTVQKLEDIILERARTLRQASLARN